MYVFHLECYNLDIILYGGKQQQPTTTKLYPTTLYGGKLKKNIISNLACQGVSNVGMKWYLLT